MDPKDLNDPKRPGKSNKFNDADTSFMRIALEEAQRAAKGGDVPVGAVLVHTHTQTILATGRNTCEIQGMATGHAEINAISHGCAVLGGWRLSDCTLYVTLEPCPMCAGAILHARIPRVVCGTADPVAGAMGSVWALHRHPIESRHTKIEMGCLEEECQTMLKGFFRNRRKATGDS